MARFFAVLCLASAAIAAAQAADIVSTESLAKVETKPVLAASKPASKVETKPVAAAPKLAAKPAAKAAEKESAGAAARGAAAKQAAAKEEAAKQEAAKEMETAKQEAAARKEAADREAAKKADNEIHWPNSDEVPPLKNKIYLAAIGFLNLHLFGVDRCYLGNTKLGVIKGITCGGLLVWAIFDWCVIALNMFYAKQSIDEYGFRARFGDDKQAVWACRLWFTGMFLHALTALTKQNQAKNAENAEQNQANAAGPYIVLQA